MQQIYQLLIGIALLALGFPIGNILAKITKEELKSGRKWFRLIILFSLISSLVFLITGNDVFLFTFLFIAVVTSRSLKK
jgi:hypothetical protein